MTLFARLGAPVAFGAVTGLAFFLLSHVLSLAASGWYREAVLYLTFAPAVNGIAVGVLATLYVHKRLSVQGCFEAAAQNYLTALVLGALAGLVVAPLILKFSFKSSPWLVFSPFLGILLFSTLLRSAEMASPFGPLGRWVRGRRPLGGAPQRLGHMGPAAGSLTWGGRPVSKQAEVGHFLVVGSPGSGKSVTINRLLRTLLPRVTAGEARMLLYDGKTEMVSTLFALGLPDKNRILTHPFDARGASWSVARDITTPQEAQELARTLFPPQRTSQPFFENAAADLLHGAVLGFIAKLPGRWTLRDLCLALNRASLLRQVLAWSPENEGRKELYFRNRRTLNDVMATIRSKVGRYEVVAAHWHRAEQAGRTFSLAEWISKGGVIVLGNSHRSGDAVNAINGILFKRASQVLLDPQQNELPTWVVLDELSKAGKLDGLDTLLTKGRTKGVSSILGFQDISGLEHQESYGPQLAEEITAQVTNKAFFRLAGPRTSKWAEATLGSMEAIHTQFSQDGRKTTASQHRETKPVVLASDILGIPPLGERGLKGFFTGVDHPDVWEYWTPMNVIRENPLPDPARDFEAAPEANGSLPPWSKEEAKALGIRATAVRARQGERDEEDDEELDLVR